MPYDIELDLLLEKRLNKYNVEKKKMFGGTCYMENDKMVCGVWKDNIILRLGEEESIKAVKEKKAEEFDITGKPMKGWIMIKKKDKLTEESIIYWTELARKHVKKIKK